MRISTIGLGLVLLTGGLDKKFNGLKKALRKSRPRNEVADRALSAKFSKVAGYAYLDRKAGVVVLLSCGLRLCVNDALLLKVARHLHRHMAQGKPPRPR